jgi:O-antigen ligase
VRFVLRKLPVQAVLLGHGALLLVLLSAVALRPNVGIYRSIARSALFFQDPLADPTGAWRLAGWQQELKTAFEHPLTGQGLGGYSEWFDGRQWQRVAIHNDYIMYFSKFGVVGILLLAAALGSWHVETMSVVHSEGDRYWELTMRVLQICVLMHMVFASFFTFSVFFWILLGAGTVLVREKHSSHTVHVGSARAFQAGHLASPTLRSGT